MEVVSRNAPLLQNVHRERHYNHQDSLQHDRCEGCMDAATSVDLPQVANWADCKSPQYGLEVFCVGAE